MSSRIFNILIAIDQLMYVLVTLGYGLPDETLSGAAWRTEKSGRLGGKIFRPVIDTLFFFSREHCRNAYLWEVKRASAKAIVTPEPPPA